VQQKYLDIEGFDNEENIVVYINYLLGVRAVVMKLHSLGYVIKLNLRR
jgi:hypothetical protein